MNKLKELREKNKYTQYEIATKLNIPKTTYASYEQEYRKLPVRTAITLGNLYNVDWKIFFEKDVRDTYVNI
ncbi:helix-turn-helix domain-containing protein [Mammaliicoccus sciuri]|uniref:helix-turn-helix domain-containing protein n=2 Tax=Mammaliicoccus sciuri TaxID=1296 RepID=UPI0019512429|nr:helix-turn-helix transcriptional regulator [Mammaliicoccus sciuri]MCD8760762.1 helix-turn-helix transcriptional regulator [Mammaliicoccus sciuri]